MTRNGAWGKLAMLCQTSSREAPPGYDFASNVMHVDADSICAKCLEWVTPHDIVRRTAFGLIQHEACTPPLPRDRARSHGLSR